MGESQIEESTRTKVREFVQDPQVVEMHAMLKESLGKSSKWNEVEYGFFETVADVAGDPTLEVKTRLAESMRFLVNESEPDGIAGFSRLLGVGSPQVGVDPRPGEGKLLKVVRGIEIRAASIDWTKEDGVYVGPPSKDYGTTIYHRDFVGQLDRELVRESLQGQRLYVQEKDQHHAEWLIAEFGLEAGQHLDPQGWKQILKRCCSRAMSLSLTGAILKLAIQCRPGELGNFARALTCCALEAFQRNSAELLPLPLPPLDEAGLAIEDRIRSLAMESTGDDEAWKAVEEVAPQIGETVWTWLQVLVTNFLYCQGVNGRMITEGMLHGKTPTKAQEEAILKLRQWSRKWLSGDQTNCIRADSWENLAESLGDLYTGPSLGKSYPLTLEAILPTTPGALEAARVALADVVSPAVRDYVNQPDLLRIPDEELVCPRTSAVVQVESQDEWNKVVAHLVAAGMLEREVPSETLRFKDVPVRNGAFGVHKKWVMKEDGRWLRTLRLIINMIPGNSFQRRMPVRASEKMGYAPLWGNLYLHDDEVIICAAEDQKHCFHIYRPGYAWRSFFSLNKKAAGWAFGDGNDQAGYPRVKSAPMGWNNVVDFIQDGFENIAREAGLSPAQMIKMGEPSPLQALDTPRSFFSFYVDNYDQLTMVWRTDRGLYEGQPTCEQLLLREKMSELTVGRDPNKAAEGTLTWVTLGAEVDGEAGWVGSSMEFRRALTSSNLGLLGGELVRTDSPNLQSVVSKNMHSVQYCRPLSCLFDHLYIDLNKSVPRVVSEKAMDEVLLLTGALPMHWMDLRMKISGQVYATDASLEGGGACVSTGLSSWGLSRLQSLSHEVDGMEGQATRRMVVIEMFAGMGGLKQALDLIGLEPMGVVAVDASPECMKVYRQHCRHCIWIKDALTITKKDVLEWRRRFPRAEEVLLGGGWPCINHSALNVNRQGAAGASSQLLDAMLQIRQWLTEVSQELNLKPWKLYEFYENVVMDDEDYAVQSRKIGFAAHFLEAGQVGRCRRPRLYWVKNVEMIPGVDMRIINNVPMRGHSYHVKEVDLDTERPPMSWFLNDKAVKMADEEEPFATFTRPTARSAPPPSPAGLEQASEAAKRRWRGDAYRLQPYQYEPRNLVRDHNGPRRPMPEEQLRMMGFTSSHLNTKARLSQDQKGQMIGNSFSAIAVARLLVGLVLSPEDCARSDVTLALWNVWKAKEEKVQAEDRPWKVRFSSVAAGMPGTVSLREQVLPSPVMLVRPWVDPQGWMTDEETLAYLLVRNGTHRSAEIRVDLGTPFSVGELCRQSVDPSHWVWRVLLSYEWKEKGQHINTLELVAILDLLRRQGRDVKNQGKRLIALVDNMVAMSCLSKGRSSSRSLQAPLRRISAVCLAAHVRLCLAWVKSQWNPADGPSRWAKKRRQT
jgi:site-specific DNA-cytosine methylase